MKKILLVLVMAVLLLTACGGEAEDLQSELDLAESAVSICLTSLEEEVTATSGLKGALSGALDALAESEEDLKACTEEVISLSLGPEMGGGGEDEEVACDGTWRTVMISTPVLQQAVDKDGDPKYNANDRMIMVAVPDSWIEGFTVDDTVCVTKHYAVSGGWSVFLISGTRSADYNLFIPAHYLEPLPEEPPPFVP